MPHGRRFLVADLLRNGVWVVVARALRVVRFVLTGGGAHSIHPARDAHRSIVGNRDPRRGGGGRELRLSGRYDAEVDVFSTVPGHVKYRVPVRPGPHGLLVWPQLGRFSLGRTGSMR